MYRWVRHRGWIALAFVVMAWVSLLVVFAGDGSARVQGAIGLLLFGGGGLTWFAGELATRHPPPPRVGPVRLPGGRPDHGLILPIPAAKARAGVVSQAIVVAALLLVVLYSDEFRWRGEGLQLLFVALAVVLGMSALNGVRGWREAEPCLALTPAGVLLRGLGDGWFAPWGAITRVVRWQVRGQPFLGVDVDRTEAVERYRGVALVTALDEAMRGHAQSIPLAGLALPPEQVERLVRHYLARPDDRPGLARGLDETDMAAASDDANEARGAAR